MRRQAVTFWDKFAWLPVKTRGGWIWLERYGVLRIVSWDDERWETAPNGVVVPADIQIVEQTA
jgi:hypothetical protein